MERFINTLLLITNMKDAKLYYQLGQQAELLIDRETSEENRASIRKVSAQNYFYAGICAIEYLLKIKAKIGVSQISNHREREKIMKRNHAIFKNKNLIFKYNQIITSIRIRTAYEGKNGNDFAIMKEFADICMDELNFLEKSNP